MDAYKKILGLFHGACGNSEWLHGYAVPVDIGV
jgi:hypothetical protein